MEERALRMGSGGPQKWAPHGDNSSLLVDSAQCKRSPSFLSDLSVFHLGRLVLSIFTFLELKK